MSTDVLLAFIGTATAFSLFQVPYVALPAELTGSYDERTRLLGWRVVVLTAAILLFGAGGPMLRRATGDPVTGYLLMGIVAGIVLGIGMLIATHSARDAVPAPVESPANLHRADETPGTPGNLVRTMQSRGEGESGRLWAGYAEGIRALRRSIPFRSLLSAFFLQALATGRCSPGRSTSPAGCSATKRPSRSYSSRSSVPR